MFTDSDKKKRAKRFAKSVRWGVIIGTFLFVGIGYFFQPTLYGCLSKFSFYKSAIYTYSLFSYLGATFYNLFLLGVDKKLFLYKWIAAIYRWDFGIKKVLCGILFCIVTVVIFICSAIIGMNFRIDNNVQNPAIERGDVIVIEDYDESLVVAIIPENGAVSDNMDAPYKVVCVKPQTIPLKNKVLNFPRYFLYKLRGIEPVDVMVEPIEAKEEKLSVCFADPLISCGDRILVWDYNLELFGNSLFSQAGDFTLYFEYSLDREQWQEYKIQKTENILTVKEGETVSLRWKNNWEIGLRNLLNYQEYDNVRGGDTVYFYYPGERVLLDWELLKCFCQDYFWEKGKAYMCGVKLENCQNTVMYNDEIGKMSYIPLDNASEESGYIMKTGRQIMYCCYINGEDLGSFYITLENDKAVWHPAGELKQDASATLRMDIEWEEET